VAGSGEGLEIDGQETAAQGKRVASGMSSDTLLRHPYGKQPKATSWE